MADLPRIKVALNLDDQDTPNLCSMAMGIKTNGDPDVTDPTYTDAELQTMAGDTMAVHVKRATNQSKSLTLQENELTSKVRSAIFDVGMDVEKAANKVAKAQGSVAAGEAVVVRCGFQLKKKSVKPPRGFEVVETGNAMIHLRVKSVGRRSAYAWRYGITSEEGKPPAQFLPILFTLECEIIINNLTKGAIYGYQVASILPVSHSSKTNPALNTITEKSTVMTSTKAKKPAFTAGIDPLNWCDLIYEGTR